MSLSMESVAGWVKRWVDSLFLRKTGKQTFTGTLTVNGTATLPGGYVDLTNAQTVAGVKTWSNNQRINGLVGVNVTPAGGAQLDVVASGPTVKGLRVTGATSSIEPQVVLATGSGQTVPNLAMNRGMSINQTQIYSMNNVSRTSGQAIVQISGILTNYRYTLVRITYVEHAPSAFIGNHLAAIALFGLLNTSGSLQAELHSHALIKNRKIAVSVSGTNWNFRVQTAVDADVAVSQFNAVTVEVYAWDGFSAVGPVTIYP